MMDEIEEAAKKLTSLVKARDGAIVVGILINDVMTTVGHGTALMQIGLAEAAVLKPKASLLASMVPGGNPDAEP